MLGLKLREEFRSRRLKGTAIELVNSNETGGLPLLPKKSNASYGDLTHAEKRRTITARTASRTKEDTLLYYSAKYPHYNDQNILARTLCDDAYDRNPGLRQFVDGNGIKLRPHTEFKKAELGEAQ